MPNVPNTETFRLSDVYDVVKYYSPLTAGNLESCFTNAIPSYFDPAYNNDGYAIPYSMKRFRNYGLVPPVVTFGTISSFDIKFFSATVFSIITLHSGVIDTYGYVFSNTTSSPTMLNARHIEWSSPGPIISPTGYLTTLNQGSTCYVRAFYSYGGGTYVYSNTHSFATNTPQYFVNRLYGGSSSGVSAINIDTEMHEPVSSLLYPANLWTNAGSYIVVNDGGYGLYTINKTTGAASPSASDLLVSNSNYFMTYSPYHDIVYVAGYGGNYLDCVYFSSGTYPSVITRSFGQQIAYITVSGASTYILFTNNQIYRSTDGTNFTWFTNVGTGATYTCMCPFDGIVGGFAGVLAVMANADNVNTPSTVPYTKINSLGGQSTAYVNIPSLGSSGSSLASPVISRNIGGYPIFLLRRNDQKAIYIDGIGSYDDSAWSNYENIAGYSTSDILFGTYRMVGGTMYDYSYYMNNYTPTLMLEN